MIPSCRASARLAGHEDDEPVTFDYALRISIENGLIREIEIDDDAAAARTSAA